MSERVEFKCPCVICFAVLLIVTGVKLLSRELKAHQTCLHTASQPAE